jgi:hypothetical protein
MTGRRLASIFAIVLGVISFFLPLVTVSAPSLDGELRWSGFTVSSELLGITSEHFYDIASAIVYGGDDTSRTGESDSTRSADTHGAYAAFTSICALALAYLIFVLVVATVLFKYSPSWVSRFSISGFLTAAVGLIATLIKSRQLDFRQNVDR